MSLLDGRAIRDWCKQKFQFKDDMLKTVETVKENMEEGKSVDALVIKEVFQSVSDGKELLASAITDKGVSTDAGATFSIMAENVGKIQGGNGGDCPITSPYEFVLNWTQFTLSSEGVMRLAIDFPVQKLRKFVIKRLLLTMEGMTTINTVGLMFGIYGTPKGGASVTGVKYYSVSVSGVDKRTGADITDLEIDLSKWEEINYCEILKYASWGDVACANATLEFRAELYF